MWILPAAGGSLRRICEDAWGAAVSPDGRDIAFGRRNHGEVWMIGSDGLRERLVERAELGFSYGSLAWSPDCRRIAWLKRNQAGDYFAIESREIATGLSTVVVSDPRLRSFCWSPDGRLIYSRLESPPAETSSNLWEIRTDKSGRAQGQPRRITNWGGFQFSYLGISRDASRLAFVRFRFQSDVYVGELEDQGTRLTRRRRLTMDERIDWPSGWTRDGRQLLFYSDRNGEFDLFRQDVSAREPTVLLSSTDEEKRDPRLSPDGAWILYMAWPGGSATRREGRLMRIPASGGSPLLVCTVKGYPGSARLAPDAQLVLTAAGHPRFRCSSAVRGASSVPCVLSELENNSVVFTAVSPIEGRQGELFRVAVDPSRATFWDLSPDGRHIAFGVRDERPSRLRILSLEGATVREMDLGKWTHLESAAWASDGAALFLTGWASNGVPLLRVSDAGARLLYRAPFLIENPSPSPDGKFLAFGEVTSDSNAWVIENLR